MQQYALITINIGQAGFATCGRSKARIKGEHARVCVKLPDIQHIRSHGSRQDGVILRLLTNIQLGVPFTHIVLLCNSSRSEEHTSELQSLMRISYAVFCLKKKIKKILKTRTTDYSTHTTKPTNTQYQSTHS